MIISIARARELMSQQANKRYSDEQVAEAINVFTILSDLVIDNYVAKKRVQREAKTKKTATSKERLPS